MDTTFPDNALRPRAIDSETLWPAAHAVIIAAEASTGLLLALGAVVLLGGRVPKSSTTPSSGRWPD